jgi:hypothetical protein
MITPQESEKLREPFPKAKIQTVNKKGTNLDYISHATVTRRLLEVDPNYTLKVAENPLTGEQRIIHDPLTGIPTTMCVELTIHGTTFQGYGSYTPSMKQVDLNAMIENGEKWSYQRDPDAYKKMFSDGLSTAAMRAGIALQLWDKTEINSEEDQFDQRRAEIYERLRLKVLANKETNSAFVVKVLGADRKLKDASVDELVAVEVEIDGSENTF